LTDQIGRGARVGVAPAASGPQPSRTVRDVTLDVFRRHGMTTIFGNPGSTEIPLLAGLPDDISFVLALHEGSVVGIATGYALAREEPALVNLHTAPGLGNAVNAIANARDLRAPLVILVGQQDRRHVASGPFLTGHGLERLAGEYPVWATQPARPQDVPGAVARAWHEARTRCGPALVVVPMGDWEEEADEEGTAVGAPLRLVNIARVDDEAVDELAALIADARAPALIVGAGIDSVEGWVAVVALAERLRCPVWQEAFCARAGFPQDHPLFAGHVHWSRRRRRETLAAHDLVIVVGSCAFRFYLYDEGPAVAPGTVVALITDDPAEAHRSPVELALLAPPAATCAALAERVAQRPGESRPPREGPAAPPAPPRGAPLRPGHVFAALAERLPAESVVVEETPSSQPELYERLPVRSPHGFYSAPNGGLGFGLTGAIGLRMGDPTRPVVGIVGDGASMYTIQSLWSAAHYGVGVLLVVMANGGYRVMDGLAASHGRPGAWPSFENVDVSGLARAFGCPALRVETYDELLQALDDIVPGLAGRSEPLVLEVALGPGR
jgi:thiamine pyrophosphate-dependent acetolactate synthase large subunit-like protein